MKKIFTFFLVSIALIPVIIAQTALPIYEPFNGTLGNLSGQNGWTGNTTVGNAAQVVNTPLSYSGLQGLSSSNSVLFGSQTSGGTQALGFASQTTTVFASFLIQVSSMPLTPANSRYNFGFGSSTTGGTFAGCLFVVPTSATNFELAFNGTNTQPTSFTSANSTSQNFTLNTTIMVVMAYTPGASGAGTVTAWVNPTSTSFGNSTAPSPSFSAIAGGSITTVASVFIRSGSNTNPMIIDELRVGLTWSDVTTHNVPLPADISNFSISTKQNNSLLSWNSITEINFDKYEIQFSANGNDYIKIGTIFGKGNNSKYEFNHYHINNGYFRLKMIDKEGKYIYSNTLFAQSNLISINTYPNPVINKLIIGNLPTGNLDATLYSLKGASVLYRKINQVNNSLDLSTIHSGQYLLKVFSNNDVIYSRIILKNNR